MYSREIPLMVKVEKSTSNFLERILSPVSVSEFQSKYWQQSALHIPGPTDKFDWLFKESDAQSLVDDPSIEFLVIEDQGDGVRDRHDLDGRNARELYDRGVDMHAMDFEQKRALWSEAAASIGAELGFVGEVKLISILTQEDFPVGLHFDGRGVINIQIAGEKRWKVDRQVALSWPARYGQDRKEKKSPSADDDREPWQEVIYERRPSDDSLLEFTMKPGHLAYVPAGLWHTVPEATKLPSTSLLITFETQAVYEILFEMVASVMSPDVQNRALPLNAELQGSDTLSPMLKRGVEALQQLDERALTHALIKAKANTPKTVVKGEVLSEPVGLDSHLIHAYSGPMYLVADDDDATPELFHGPHQVSFDDEHEVAFARGLMEARQFTAREACEWASGFDEGQAIEMLQGLVDAGVLLNIEAVVE